MTMTDPGSAAGILGVKYSIVVAGFFGDLFSLAYLRDLTRLQSAAAVATGLIVSTYATPAVIRYAGIPSDLDASVAFAVGLCAMNLIPGLLRISEIWRERLSVRKGGEQ